MEFYRQLLFMFHILQGPAFNSNYISCIPTSDTLDVEDYDVIRLTGRHKKPDVSCHSNDSEALHRHQIVWLQGLLALKII